MIRSIRNCATALHTGSQPLNNRYVETRLRTCRTVNERHRLRFVGMVAGVGSYCAVFGGVTEANNRGVRTRLQTQDTRAEDGKSQLRRRNDRLTVAGNN